jgi:hypothetical protein
VASIGSTIVRHDGPQPKANNLRKMQYSSDLCIVCLTTARGVSKLSGFNNKKNQQKKEPRIRPPARPPAWI